MSSEGDGFMRVFLIRHAESYSNTQGRMMSTTDLALTEKGIRQAERAGIALHTALRGKERLYVFSSPLLRTRQTAEAVLRQFPAAPAVRETADLREMELGLLEGLTWQERDRMYPQICLETNLSGADVPGGESFGDVRRRCSRFIEQSLAACPESAAVLVFSHGITLRVLTNVLLGRPDGDVNRLNWMEHTAITEIAYDAQRGTARPVCINDYTHLKELCTADYPRWGLFADMEY